MSIPNALPFLGAVQQLRGEVEEVHELADSTIELSAAHAWRSGSHPPFHAIQHRHSHGDVCLWPVKVLCDYVEATNDLGFFDRRSATPTRSGSSRWAPHETLWAHCDRVLAQCQALFLRGTALVDYGDGDWDDTLQPADPAVRTRMVSAWTVALAYQTLRQLSEICRGRRARRLDAVLERMRADFHEYLIPGGTVAGFMVHEDDGAWRPCSIRRTL